MDHQEEPRLQWPTFPEVTGIDENHLCSIFQYQQNNNCHLHFFYRWCQLKPSTACALQPTFTDFFHISKVTGINENHIHMSCLQVQCFLDIDHLLSSGHFQPPADLSLAQAFRQMKWNEIALPCAFMKIQSSHRWCLLAPKVSLCCSADIFRYFPFFSKVTGIDKESYICELMLKWNGFHQHFDKHRKDCESALWAKSALFKVSFY